MCLIAIAYQVHPDYPLIVAANRDEFYNRPTAPLDFWSDHPDILAGRDLQGHGTWLGVNRAGRIAAVTNYREPQFKSIENRSRGFLVSEFLAGNDSPDAYLEQVTARKDDYGGFNLIVGDTGGLWWYSNRGDALVKLPRGIHAISNRALNTPWPKVERTRERLSKLIGHSRIDPESVFAMLYDRSRPPDELLPDTGVGLDWERLLSPPFVTSAIYGTRSSSVVLFQQTGTLEFLERTFEPVAGELAVKETRRFQLQFAMAPTPSAIRNDD